MTTKVCHCAPRPASQGACPHLLRHWVYRLRGGCSNH